MNYWGENPHEMPYFTEGGKTYTSALLAYWRLMNTPAEGEDADGTLDERFTPRSEAELEQRMAFLNSVAVAPLPEDIENLSDSSRFLIPERGTPERVNGPVEDVAMSREEIKREAERFTSDTIATSTAVAKESAAEWARFGIAHPADVWVRAFSTVLIARLDARSATAKRNRATMARPVTVHACEKLLNGDYVAQRTAEFESRHYTISLDNEQLRDAVHSYFSLRTSITIVVDNTGAARDPNAALESLIADATRVGAAEDEDGTRALVVTAPPVTQQQCRHEAGRPRMAVIELPRDAPIRAPQPQNENVDESTLLRQLIRGLTML